MEKVQAYIDQNIQANIGPYFWESILDAVFVFALIIVSFVLIKTILKSRYIQNWSHDSKIFKAISFCFCGIIASLTTIWYIYMPSWNLTFFIFGLLTFSFFMNMYFMIGTIPLILTATLINYFKNANIQQNDAVYYLILNSVLIFLGLLFSIVSIYIKWKNNFIFLFTNSNYIVIGFAICFPLIVTGAIKNAGSFSILAFGLNFIFYVIISLLCFSIFKVIDRFISKTEKISEEISYINGFIIEKFANEMVHEFIQKNKINRALVMRIDIQGLDKLLYSEGYSHSTEIKNLIIDNLSTKLKEFNILFYMQKDNSEYFAIINIDANEEIDLALMEDGNKLRKRKEKDYLAKIEKIVQETIDESKQLISEVKIFAYCSLYGIDNTNIEEINDGLCKMNIANSGIYLNKIIMIRNIQHISFNKTSKNRILSDLNLFGPNDIYITLNKVTKKGKNLFYISASNLKPFVTTKEELWALSDDEQISSAIMCHISAKGIKEFTKQKLDEKSNNIIVLDYPQYLLCEVDFSIYELISRINSYGIDNSQYYLDIRINKKSFNENFVRNIQSLIDNHINFLFEDVPKDINKVDLLLLKKFKPIAINYK